jgi:ketosteroid isomerase-like protein
MGWIIHPTGGVLPFGGGPKMSSVPANDDDVRAIEALNQQDVKAVMAGDIETIISQWTDDFIVLSAGSIVRGRTANAEIAERGKAQIETMEVLEYRVDFEEIKVLDDYAYEWGTYRGKTRIRTSGELVTYGGKLLRILQKQVDGAWKMHRTIATVEPPSA